MTTSMPTITTPTVDQHQKITSGKPKNEPLRRPSSLSEKQKSDVEAFLRIFLSEHDVLAYFAPVKWPAAIANVKDCTAYPNMTLQMLDLTYCEGTAARMVENNIRGIFSLARPHEPIVDASVRLTAQLFVAKYGTELSVFAALLYFAQYLTDYKSSYGQFDLVDVLRQCGKQFLPKWCARLSRKQTKDAQQMEGCREVGKAALYKYLRREYVAKGIDIRTSPIVRLSSFSDQEIEFIMSGEPLLL